ncbi:MAG TPA: hypothetical protein VFX58_10235, partial [Chitinophagaceae bacterium]|nr:hypothetical protein [Chitinophagaceae bacterium]
MIRLFITLAFLFIQFNAGSQSLEEIKSAAGKDQWEKARSGIDRWLSDATNAKNPEGWYLKSLILFKIVSNKESRALAPAGQRESFDAYKKYLDLLAAQKKEIPADHEILFGLYFNEVDRANHEFQYKNYAEALQGFLEVEEMEQYMLKKGLQYQDFRFPAFDTQLYVNIAAAAASAGREDLALDYYRKIADQKIAGKGFDGIYRYLVDRFDKKGDRSTRDK